MLRHSPLKVSTPRRTTHSSKTLPTPLGSTCSNHYRSKVAVGWAIDTKDKKMQTLLPSSKVVQQVINVPPKLVVYITPTMPVSNVWLKTIDPCLMAGLPPKVTGIILGTLNIKGRNNLEVHSNSLRHASPLHLSILAAALATSAITVAYSRPLSTKTMETRTS